MSKFWLTQDCDSLFPDLQDEEIDLFDDVWGSERNVKCECGSDNVYGKDNEAHSDWCPKNKKVKNE